MALFHVIDDEKFMCELISKMLAMHGHETRTFLDPHQYLTLLDEGELVSPIAVITDLLMPTMDGYELIEEVIRRNSNQKFIVISGTPHLDSRIQHTACHYLCKPFRVTELINIVNTLMHCSCHGPSPTLGCRSLGNREKFLTEWRCPLPERHHS